MNNILEMFSLWFIAWVLVGFLTGFKMLFVDNALSEERRERFKNDPGVSWYLSSKTLFLFVNTSLGFFTPVMYWLGYRDAKREIRESKGENK